MRGTHPPHGEAAGCPCRGPAAPQRRPGRNSQRPRRAPRPSRRFPGMAAPRTLVSIRARKDDVGSLRQGGGAAARRRQGGRCWLHTDCGACSMAWQMRARRSSGQRAPVGTARRTTPRASGAELGPAPWPMTATTWTCVADARGVLTFAENLADAGGSLVSAAAVSLFSPCQWDRGKMDFYRPANTRMSAGNMRRWLHCVECLHSVCPRCVCVCAPPRRPGRRAQCGQPVGVLWT